MTSFHPYPTPLDRVVLAGPPRIFITGPRRVGKSTLVRAVLAQSDSACGFLVIQATPSSVEGYDLLLLPQGNRVPLARKRWPRGARFGAWRFHTEIFDDVLARHLSRCALPGHLTVLDELGFVERNNEPFRAAVARALLRPGPLLGVVQLRALPNWLPLLRRANVPLIYLSATNRADWQRILSDLFRRVPSAQAGWS